MKREEKFLRLLVSLNEPVMTFGVAKILGVKLVDTQKVAADGKAPIRDAADIIDDIITNFALAPSKRQRELIQIVGDAIKEKKNGSGTEDSENQA